MIFTNNRDLVSKDKINQILEQIFLEEIQKILENVGILTKNDNRNIRSSISWMIYIEEDLIEEVIDWTVTIILNCSFQNEHLGCKEGENWFRSTERRDFSIKWRKWNFNP